MQRHAQVRHPHRRPAGRPHLRRRRRRRHRAEPDLLSGSSDDAHGGPGRDCIDGGDDVDDVLNASDAGGNDFIDGGPGNDTCYGDPGDTIVNCEKVIRVPAPLLVNPSGPVPLPRALGGPDVVLPPLAK